MQSSSAPTSADVAYVILASPYATRLAKDGFIDAASVLELHLWVLARLPNALAAVLVVLANHSGREELPGYADVREDAKRLPCPLHLMRAPNNTLGSCTPLLSASPSPSVCTHV